MVFPIWSAVPFAVMLASIAIFPTAAPHWWESNRNKLGVSVVASIPVLFLVISREPILLAHSLVDYLSFVVLLGALYIIAGGIFIRGAYAGTPLVNTLFLSLGALLSNVIGTTGASMLLIRPYLRANHRRQHRSHLVIFFIFIVSNIAGVLTPVGDPPLFLGFLRGVPFHWTLRLIPHWALAVGFLLIVFNLYDQYIFEQEDVETAGALIEDVQPRRRLHVEGGRNFVYLLGVIVSTMLSGYFGWPKAVTASIMIAIALLSWLSTPRKVHEANHFHFHPILEVAAVFLGIFITMIPALEILNARAATMSLTRPWEFFWLTGILSGFLDNAPAYLTLAAMASGITGGTVENFSTLVHSGLGEKLLAAISCGAVFMGATTYIGNGPNFMVKSIAQRSGIKMPSFGGYLVYSGMILLPLFVVITLVFFM